MKTKRGRASEKCRKKAGRFSDFRLGTRRPRIQEHTIRGGEWLFPLFTLSKKRKNTTWYQCSLFRICVTNSPQMYFIGPRQDKARETEGFFSRWLTQTQKDLNHIFLLSIHRYSRSVDFQFQTSQCSNGAWSGELLDSRHLKDFQGDGEPERWRERDAEGQNAH